MAITSKPRSSSKSTMWLPMNPAPPVTIARLNEAKVCPRTGHLSNGRGRPAGAAWVPCQSMSVDKVWDLHPLADHLQTLRAEGKRIVHCHGVFDPLHVGHMRYFKAAAQHGDV